MSRDEKLIALQQETEVFIGEFEKHPEVYTLRQVGNCLRLIHERMMRLEAEMEKYNDGLRSQM